MKRVSTSDYLIAYRDSQAVHYKGAHHWVEIKKVKKRVSLSLGAMCRHGSGREGQPDGADSCQCRGRKGQATGPMRGAVTALGQPDKQLPGAGTAQIQ